MLPKIQKFNAGRSLFAALFHPMSRTLTDAGTGAPALFFTMTWGSALQVFKENAQGELLIESRFNRKLGLQAWEVFVGDKKVGTMKAELMRSALSLGTEHWTILDVNGKEALVLEAEERSTLSHVLDNVSALYNPTHGYTVRSASGKEVAKIAMKQGFWKDFYDLTFVAATEPERELTLALFSALLLMLKK